MNGLGKCAVFYIIILMARSNVLGYRRMSACSIECYQQIALLASMVTLRETGLGLVSLLRSVDNRKDK